MAETTSRLGSAQATGQSVASGMSRAGSAETGQGWAEAMRTGGRPDHTEGVVARTIEEQTAKLPSDLFLWAAGASIIGSLVLQCTGRKEESTFVGQWAPTFLLLGLYNKIVKVAGSDALHR